MPLNFDELIRNSAVTNYLSEGNAEPLIRLLRSETKLTPELRNFIADILEGKIKKRAGRKKGSGEKAYLRSIYKLELDQTMMVLRAVNSQKPQHGFDAYREALDILAERYGMTPDQLDKIIYPRKRKKIVE